MCGGMRRENGELFDRTREFLRANELPRSGQRNVIRCGRAVTVFRHEQFRDHFEVRLYRETDNTAGRRVCENCGADTGE